MPQPTEQPSSSEYSVLLNTKNQLESTLTELTLFAQYEKMEAPEGRGATNLLDYLTRGQKDALSGVRLAGAIEAVNAQLLIVNARFDDWKKRDESFKAALLAEGA